ncbi:defensin-like protein 183 [Vicia villosa]|uniref:defensin-like protein 183 n=1 Tax=Vicia villosa TaxID=3911 RepID=UPI00273B951F|nr:defensin-like protein 183 [Vicia villosa]
MAYKMSKSCCFFAILVLVFAVKLPEVEGECTKIVGRCSVADCSYDCSRYAKGVHAREWNCDFFGLCTCKFDKPPPGSQEPACNIGIGLCNHECDESCCNAKCVSKYKDTGVGKCFVDFGKEYCLCSYSR